MAALLDDWHRHLGSTNRAESTKRRYLKDARALLAYFLENEMPSRPEAITREHLERFFVFELTRPRRRAGKAATLSPATVAGCYRSLQQL